ncbi:MAG: hypothetical protein PHO37_09565 [Kiritimatiellae bacterium]|nr:hypothetical protein [Kiritimatiellia bacterium]
MINPTWQQVFVRLDLAGSADQRVGSLISSGNAARGRAVINSTAATTSTLTLNTLGSGSFEGVIGASGPCASPGAINLIKEGGGAQIFKQGQIFVWNNNVPGTNMVNANVTVNAGAIGFSGIDVLGSAYAVTISANGALIAPDKATLDALRADNRFTVDTVAALGLYDNWDLSAADPNRMFYYSGGVTLTSDNTAALPNGLILAAGDMRVGVDGAAGDAVFGPVDKPLILNGTSIKNSNNDPVLSANRTMTLNAGGVAFTAGWNKTLTVLSKLTGGGALTSAIVDVHRSATLAVGHDNAFGGAASTTRLSAGIDNSTLGQQARIEIPAGVDVAVRQFAINGVSKSAGSWGATGSNADNVNDAIFTGAGILTVLETGPAYGTLLQVR